MELRSYLKLKGVSQAALARELGVHNQTVFKWCSGIQVPERRNALAIKRWSKGKVTLDDLMGGEIDKSRVVERPNRIPVGRGPVTE